MLWGLVYEMLIIVRSKQGELGTLEETGPQVRDLPLLYGPWGLCCEGLQVSLAKGTQGRDVAGITWAAPRQICALSPLVHVVLLF